MKNKFLKKFVAVLLLAVFAMSTAPKAYFHALLADHKDFSSCNDQVKSSHLHTQSVNCHFDDLVVTIPYVRGDNGINFLTPRFYKVESSAYFTSHTQETYSFKDTRGPPAA